MKKVIASAISGTLAATLLVGATGAAMAQPYRGYDRGYSNSYRNDYRNDYRGYRNDYRYNRGYHRGNSNAGAAIGIGLGILALGIIASQANQNRYDYGYSGGYYYGR